MVVVIVVVVVGLGLGAWFGIGARGCKHPIPKVICHGSLPGEGWIPISRPSQLRKGWNLKSAAYNNEVKVPRLEPKGGKLRITRIIQIALFNVIRDFDVFLSSYHQMKLGAKLANFH